MWLSKYLLPFCSLPEVGKRAVASSVRGQHRSCEHRQEAALASAVLAICLQNVFFISSSDRDVPLYVCVNITTWPDTWLVTSFEAVLNWCCLWWCSCGQCWGHGRNRVSASYQPSALGLRLTFNNVEYHPGKGGLQWNCHHCFPLPHMFFSGSSFHLSPGDVKRLSAEDQILPWSRSGHSIKSLQSHHRYPLAPSPALPPSVGFERCNLACINLYSYLRQMEKLNIGELYVSDVCFGLS